MKRIGWIGSVVLISAVLVQAEVMFQDSFEEYDPGQVTCSNWWGDNDEPTDLVIMGIWSVGAEARTGDQVYAYGCQAGADHDLAEIIESTVSLRPEGAEEGIVTGSMWAKIGSQDPDGLTNVSSKLGLFFRDGAGTIGTYMTIVGDSGNTNRRVHYFDGDVFHAVSVEWPTDEYFNMTVTANEIDHNWGFSLTTANGTELITVSDLAPADGIFGPIYGPFTTINLYVETSNTGTGFFNLIDDVAVDFSMPVTPQLPGDANDDGAVDVGDLGILAANYGTLSGATWNMGDFNGDGAVDVGDLGILAGNYGSSAAASVPEPASLGLLGMGILALLRRKR